MVVGGVPFALLAAQFIDVLAGSPVPEVHALPLVFGGILFLAGSLLRDWARKRKGKG